MTDVEKNSSILQFNWGIEFALFNLWNDERAHIFSLLIYPRQYTTIPLVNYYSLLSNWIDFYKLWYATRNQQSSNNTCVETAVWYRSTRYSELHNIKSIPVIKCIISNRFIITGNVIITPSIIYVENNYRQIGIFEGDFKLKGYY